MDSNRGKLPGYLEFLLKLERYTWCLFTITQGGIENSYFFRRMVSDKEDNSPQGPFVLTYFTIRQPLV